MGPSSFFLALLRQSFSNLLRQLLFLFTTRRGSLNLKFLWPSCCKKKYRKISKRTINFTDILRMPTKSIDFVWPKHHDHQLRTGKARHHLKKAAFKNHPAFWQIFADIFEDLKMCNIFFVQNETGSLPPNVFQHHRRPPPIRPSQHPDQAPEAALPALATFEDGKLRGPEATIQSLSENSG